MQSLDMYRMLIPREVVQLCQVECQRSKYGHVISPGHVEILKVGRPGVHRRNNTTLTHARLIRSDCPKMASQDSKKSKKRKSVGGSSSDVTISMEDSMGVGPAFGEYRSCRVWLTAVNFPAVRPSKNTPFDIYSREDDPSSSAITKQHTLIAGETEDVEYFSTNRDRYQAGEGHDCQYVQTPVHCRVR